MSLSYSFPLGSGSKGQILGSDGYGAWLEARGMQQLSVLSFSPAVLHPTLTGFLLYHANKMLLIKVAKNSIAKSTGRISSSISTSQQRMTLPNPSRNFCYSTVFWVSPSFSEHSAVSFEGSFFFFESPHPLNIGVPSGML